MFYHPMITHYGIGEGAMGAWQGSMSYASPIFKTQWELFYKHDKYYVSAKQNFQDISNSYEIHIL